MAIVKEVIDTPAPVYNYYMLRIDIRFLVVFDIQIFKFGLDPSYRIFFSIFFLKFLSFFKVNVHQ